jgi:hypothetical protein
MSLIVAFKFFVVGAVPAVAVAKPVPLLVLGVDVTTPPEGLDFVLNYPKLISAKSASALLLTI